MTPGKTWSCRFKGTYSRVQGHSRTCSDPQFERATREAQIIRHYGLPVEQDACSEDTTSGFTGCACAVHTSKEQGSIRKYIAAKRDRVIVFYVFFGSMTVATTSGSIRVTWKEPTNDQRPRPQIPYLQLSNIIGHIWVSMGYFCSFIGQDNVAEILKV